MKYLRRRPAPPCDVSRSDIYPLILHVFLLRSGLDVVGLLSKLPYLGEKMAATDLVRDLGSGATTFVIAYAVHKAFAPVRISVTLACAPLLVRYLRRKGVLMVKK